MVLLHSLTCMPFVTSFTLFFGCTSASVSVSTWIPLCTPFGTYSTNVSGTSSFTT